jgi:endo-1,4-beta-xylanase
MPLTRRSLLAVPAAAALGGSVALGLGAPGFGATPAEADGLQARAAARGLFFGSAVNDDTLTKDPDLAARVRAECGMLVSEWSFKWQTLQPKPGHFDFQRADTLMTFAEKSRLRVRGHTLVWHESNPPWLAAKLTPQTGEALLTGYIGTVGQHFRKRIAHWDVVNEPMHPEDGKPFGLRDTPWLRALGPAYLDLAFHAAAEADPGALRVLNEFGIDYAIDWQEKRRVALLNLLSALLARGVPVQAVGLQAHLDAAETALDQKVLSRFVADIASLGLKVIVTELDLRDDRLPADLASRDQAVADHARAWLDAVLPNPAVLGMLTWGLSDRRSWLNDRFPRPDGLPQRPLPLDTELNRTRLWQAIAAALAAAPARVAE